MPAILRAVELRDQQGCRGETSIAASLDRRRRESGPPKFGARRDAPEPDNHKLKRSTVAAPPLRSSAMSRGADPGESKQQQQGMENDDDARW
jgi:hypothetical protein